VLQEIHITIQSGTGKERLEKFVNNGDNTFTNITPKGLRRDKTLAGELDSSGVFNITGGYKGITLGLIGADNLVIREKINFDTGLSQRLESHSSFAKVMDAAGSLVGFWIYNIGAELSGRERVGLYDMYSVKDDTAFHIFGHKVKVGTALLVAEVVFDIALMVVTAGISSFLLQQRQLYLLQ